MIYDGAARIVLSDKDWNSIRIWTINAFGPIGDVWDSFPLIKGRTDAVVFFFSRHEDATMFALRWT